jgi:uncharacterized membrane protein YkvI
MKQGNTSILTAVFVFVKSLQTEFGIIKLINNGFPSFNHVSIRFTAKANKGSSIIQITLGEVTNQIS